MARVTALEPDRTGGGVRVHVGGAAFGTVAPQDVRELGLEVGEALDGGRLSSLAARAEVFAARSVALRLLAARALPAREITRRLIRRGHARAAAEAAVDALVHAGLIDDAEFARHYARTRAQRFRYGPARLVADLRRLGVGEREAEAAVRDALAADGIDPVVLLREAAARKLRTMGDVDPVVRRRRLKAFLLRRGFAAAAVREVVKEAPEG